MIIWQFQRESEGGEVMIPPRSLDAEEVSVGGERRRLSLVDGCKSKLQGLDVHGT